MAIDVARHIENLLYRYDSVVIPGLGGIIAAYRPAGIDHVRQHFPENTHLWIAAIDETLNAKGYIIPGLGDCGDLLYGSKLQR